MQVNEIITDINYDDALTNWHTLYESEKIGTLSGIEPRASSLPDEDFTTAPHRITMVPMNQLYTILEIFEDGL